MVEEDDALGLPKQRHETKIGAGLWGSNGYAAMEAAFKAQWGEGGL